MSEMVRKALGGLLAVAAAAVVVCASAAPASASESGFGCPGGLFCGWDGKDGGGSMVVQVDAACVLHDIGNAGVGDRVSSYWNRTGKTVQLYDWSGTRWLTLATIPDNGRGSLPAAVNDRADAVKVCA
jgi:hypothetical protein